MSRKFMILLCLIVILPVGCTMAPKYERPKAPVPETWPTGAAYKETKAGTTVSKALELKWQDFITDERLREVIGMALKNNRDLRLAVLNMEKARATYGIQRAALLPAVSAAGSMTRQRVPADLSYMGQQVVTEQDSLSVGITSWELDFSGRIRSLKDQAFEEYKATDEDRRNSQILLVSSVANGYLTLAADRESLKIVTSTYEAREVSFKLIKKRYEVGLASQLDVQQAQSLVDTARVDVAKYTQLTSQDLNALNLLAGGPVPESLLPAGLDAVSPPKEVPAGLSSEVLLQRPDVRAAEHHLRSANAFIGAARAAFFPQIFLTSSIGMASSDLTRLFKAGQGTWMFAPQITMPIFDARTWSAYDVAKASREIMVVQYEKAIQTAFREVSDALSVQGTVDRQIEAQQSLVKAIAETYRLSNARYTKGIDSYLVVLDAQRNLYSAQQALISLRLARSANLVTLYKVLGGGA